MEAILGIDKELLNIDVNPLAIFAFGEHEISVLADAEGSVREKLALCFLVFPNGCESDFAYEFRQCGHFCRQDTN